MSHQNKLRIKTQNLNVSLDGDAESIKRGYFSMRRILTAQFHDTMRDYEAAYAPPRNRQTLKIHADDHEGSRAQDRDRMVSVVVSRDIYNKLYMQGQSRLEQSILGSLIDLSAVKRIYVDETVEARLRNHIDLGDTLWRELTHAGKEVIGRGE